MDTKHTSEFQEIIQEIDTHIVDLTWAGEVLKFENFRKIYDNPAPFLYDALSSIRDPQTSVQMKTISALAMQKLDLEHYLLFLHSTLEMLNNETISAADFKWCCFPSYEWNTLLAENHTHEKVLEFLKTLVSSSHLSQQNRDYIINYVMTGKAKEEVQYLKRIGEIK